MELRERLASRLGDGWHVLPDRPRKLVVTLHECGLWVEWTSAIPLRDDELEAACEAMALAVEAGSTGLVAMQLTRSNDGCTADVVAVPAVRHE